MLAIAIYMNQCFVRVCFYSYLFVYSIEHSYSPYLCNIITRCVVRSPSTYQYYYCVVVLCYSVCLSPSLCVCVFCLCVLYVSSSPDCGFRLCPPTVYVVYPFVFFGVVF